MMNLTVLWRRLVKRPLVAVLILILAALAGYVGWISSSGQAESRLAIVVLPPWSFEDENFKNPMLNLGDRATALAGALVTAIESSDAEDSVMQAGATSYEASNIATDLRDPTRSAVITITVTGPNAKAAHDGALAIIDSTRTILKKMQEQAGTGDPPFMATLQVISQPQETTTFATRQIRGAGALAGGALIAGLLIFWAIESIIDRRSRTYQLETRFSREELASYRREGAYHDELNADSETQRFPHYSENA